jgi:uncharacterized protein
MTTEHPNAAVVGMFYEAFAVRDFTALRALFREDGVWHIPGRSPISGDHRGVDAVVDGFLRDVVARSEDTLRAEPLDVLASDRHVVVLQRSTGQRAGTALDITVCQVFRVEGGKIVEVTPHYSDLYALDAFWSAETQGTENGPSAPQAPPLLPEEIDKLVSFHGFGNPRGDFWFVGMEEQGEGTDLELRWRLSFEPVDDLMAVHHRWEQFNPDDRKFNAERLIPTWATMSKIVLRLKGHSDWTRSEEVRRYQSERLGRLNGETFLTEILPLPARSRQDWTAQARFVTRDEYEAEVRPNRIAMIRDLCRLHSPRYVFCYGAANWAYHKEIFNDVSFEPIVDGRAILGRTASSMIVLTQFFAYYLMTNDVIDGIAQAVGINR